MTSPAYATEPAPTPVPAGRRFLVLTGWVATLIGAHLLLTAAGAALPSPPPPWQLAELTSWASDTEPALAAFSVLRLLALAVTWYLMAATALALLGRCSGRRALMRLADQVTVPVARRVIHRAVGAGLAVSLSAGVVPLLSTGAPAGAATAGSPPPSQVTMRLLDGPAPGATASIPPPSPAPPSTVRMRLLDPGPGHAAASSGSGAGRSATTPAPAPSTSTTAASTTTSSVPPTSLTTTTSPSPAAAPPTSPAPTAPTPSPTPEPTPTPTPAPTPAPGPALEQWTIAPGDHLWHVAEATLTASWHRSPTVAETAQYLGQLIDLNRHRLAVATNPDLVFPGQVFELPAVAPA